MNLNRVFLAGNLTRDIETRQAGGSTVGKFGLALNRKFKTQAGEQREEVTFIDCEAWGRTAEVMQQYLGKGSPVLLEGRLKLDQWEDKDGGKRSAIRVVVESFQFVGGKGEHATKAKGVPMDEPMGEDDIPFDFR
jgi:single-strand DNA-binding protein